MTTPVSRRSILSTAGVAVGSLSIPGTLSGVGRAEPEPVCDFVWPIDGKIIYPSESIDAAHILNETGTPVFAPRAGEVTYAARVPAEPGGPGRSYQIDISHEDGYSTSYSTHATTTKVEEGDFVERGELIGPISDVGYDVPFLRFVINRNESTLSVPGQKGDWVQAGAYVPKDYPGINCPSDGPREEPGPIFGRLKNEKLTLARRIEAISGETIQEVEQVQTAINALETAATDGTISVEKANNAIRRLKYGEEVTERTLVGAGPATPLSGGEDYDIFTRLATLQVQGAIVVLISVLTCKRIPAIGKIIGKIQSFFGDIIKKALKFLYSALNRSGINSHNNLIRQVYDAANEIVDIAFGNSAGQIEKRLLTLSDEIGGLLSGLYLNSLEEELAEKLTDLTDAANPKTERSFSGSMGNAAQSRDAGIASATSTFNTASGKLDKFDNLLNSNLSKTLNGLNTLGTNASPFSSGTFQIISEIGNYIEKVGKALVKLVVADYGKDFLIINLTGRHKSTLDNIISGTPP